jgi:hypothetical protein
MPHYCPDPATFLGWQERLPLVGAGILVALALFGVVARRTHPHGRPLWLVSATSAACALALALAAFIIYARLGAALPQIRRFFPTYPTTCDLPFSYPYREFPDDVRSYTTALVAPLEQAAAVTQWLALAAVIGLALCAYAMVHTARERQIAGNGMTTVTLES